jgi:hypothetical protein
MLYASYVNIGVFHPFIAWFYEFLTPFYRNFPESVLIILAISHSEEAPPCPHLASLSVKPFGKYLEKFFRVKPNLRSLPIS